MNLINAPRSGAVAALNTATVRPALVNLPRRGRWSTPNTIPATLASLPTQPGRGGQR